MGKWTKITDILEKVPDDLLVTDEEDKPSPERDVSRAMILGGTGLLVSKEVKALCIDLGERNLDMTGIVELYYDLRDKKEELEEVLKKVKGMLDGCKSLIEDRMRTSKISTFKLTDGRGIRSQPEPVATLDKNLLAEFLDWADSNDQRHKLSMNYMTMNKLVKDMIEENLVGFEMDEEGKVQVTGLPPGVKLWFRPKLVKA